MAGNNEEAVKKAIKEAQEMADKVGEAGITAEQETVAEDISPEAKDGAAQSESPEHNMGATGEEQEQSTEGQKKEKFFGKDKKKKDKAQERINELEDKVKRQLAEFENFRNRTEKEKGQMFDMGAKTVLEKILPVVGNFERGLQTVPEEEAGKPFAEGMNMIYKQLLTELENLGVKPIEAVGKEFNPEFHNAVMQVESEEYETGFVAQELLKGYMYRDTVIRHSMVAVVQ